MKSCEHCKHWFHFDTRRQKVMGRWQFTRGRGSVESSPRSARRNIAPAANSVEKAAKWLSWAADELERREYYAVKRLCAQVIKALQRKDNEDIISRFVDKKERH